jgi:hypothetical protein
MAVLVAVVAAFVVLTIPPRRLALHEDLSDGSLPGIIHVHSSRSDGSSTPAEIAAAAGRAGLRFVVFTDHGDATRAPDAPTYRNGVLCIDAVEVSTTGGHYIALDMPPAPYPLAGDPRGVVDDVHRLGGFGIVAHPHSPKDQLQWKDFTVPFDGIEAINLDTGWRRWMQQARRSDLGARDRWSAGMRLLTALVDYPFRPPEVIASLTSPRASDAGIERTLDAAMMRRHIVMTAGADAHAKLGIRGDPGESTFSIPLPGYEQTFRTLSVHAFLDRQLTGDATPDSQTIVRAIRAGHLYSVMDGLATPAAFFLSASNASGTAQEGDQLQLGGPVAVHVRSNAPAAFTTRLWNGATAIGDEHHEADFTVTMPAGPAAYWVSIRATPERGDILWLRSNPIFVGIHEVPVDRVPTGTLRLARALFDGTTADGWHVEHDPTSVGALDRVVGTSGPELRLRYGLSAGLGAGPYVALVYDVPAGAFVGNRVTMTLRAQQPMRISVQLRSGGADRWQRSIYVATENEDRSIDVADMTPVGTTSTGRPVPSTIRSVLFVVDTTNTRAGASGRVWLRSAALAY